MNETKKKKKTTALIIILALVIVALVGLVLWLTLGGGAEKRNSGGTLISFDDSAQSGHLPGKSDEEIQAELNRIVEEGMFNISIASQVYFPDGKSDGAANIENIEANHYHMQVSITLDDTGELIYESGALKPGQFIENIKLQKALSAGTYNATATFSALDQETLETAGQAAAKITVVIES
ncbi:MAG: hypothetical protein PHY23_00470 [Oscillospiraceae bacterium]|nr:hypothetical protein [Oscillospiraceae bacterium]